MTSTAPRPFAIEENSDDGLFYLHTDRERAENGRDFTSKRHVPGRATEAEVLDLAKSLGASEGDIAPNQREP